MTTLNHPAHVRRSLEAYERARRYIAQELEREGWNFADRSKWDLYFRVWFFSYFGWPREGFARHLKIEPAQVDIYLALIDRFGVAPAFQQVYERAARGGAMPMLAFPKVPNA